MLKTLNLGVRFLLEILALVALAYWGFTAGKGWLLNTLLGLGTPIVAAVIWGIFISPNAPFPPARPIRLLLEVLVFGSAAAGLILSGQLLLGLFFAGVVIVNELLLFLWGQW
jgi:hypothetical protein